MRKIHSVAKRGSGLVEHGCILTAMHAVGASE